MLGRDADRDLIRSLARKLAEDTVAAADLRAAVGRLVAGEPPRKGGILAALRRSPLVGADLDLTRPRGGRAQGRRVMRFLLNTGIIGNVSGPESAEATLACSAAISVESASSRRTPCLVR